MKEEEGEAAAKEYADLADKCRASFNRRFWYADGGYLYDVLDGPDGKNDHSLRPNQVFAISLDFPILAQERWRPVLKVVRDRLARPRSVCGR